MYFDDFSFDENSTILFGKSVNLNEDGFIYGNMFKDEYKPYKDNKVYKLNPQSEEEALKLKIMEESFIINDLNLYLDLHKNDTNIFEIFKKHLKILNSYKNEYENRYGSICLGEVLDKYDWTTSPWPWEMND